MDAKVLNFKKYESGALQDFFDLQVDGLTLASCKCFVKGDSIWLQLPSVKSTDASGAAHYTPIVTATTTTMRAIQDAVRDQLRACIESGAGAQPGRRMKIAGTYFKTIEGEDLSEYRSKPGDDGIPY